MRRALIIGALLLLPGISFASTYGSNFLSGGTCSSDANTGGHECTKALDGIVDVTHSWESGNTAFPHYWQYDLGSGLDHSLGRLEIASYGDTGGSYIKDISVQGSADGSNWTHLTTSTYANYTTDGNWNYFNLSTSTPQDYYRYYRLTFNNAYVNTDSVIDEILMKTCISDCFTGGGSSSSTTSTTGTADTHYTVALLIVIAAILGIDLTRRMFAGKFGKPFPV